MLPQEISWLTNGIQPIQLSRFLFRFVAEWVVLNRNRDKERRGTKVGLEAQKLDPWMFCRMLAARAEASIRNDWALVPAVRNLTTKFDALCGDDVACRHAVATDIAGQSHAAELTQAAANLYKRLANGYYSARGRRRKINYDVSKLRYCSDLGKYEADLVKDVLFLTTNIPARKRCGSCAAMLCLELA